MFEWNVTMVFLFEIFGSLFISKKDIFRGFQKVNFIWIFCFFIGTISDIHFQIVFLNTIKK
ncbi:hypothetical protein MCETHM1_00642 [Flavobacteriaceae bacterium]